MRQGPGFYIQKKLADRQRERAQYEKSAGLTGVLPRDGGSGVALLRLDAIGDFLLWLGSAGAYREIFPGEPLTLLCGAAVADIAARTGWFDRVIPVRLKDFSEDPAYRGELLALFGGLSFRTLVQTVYSRSYAMEEIAAAVPAAARIAIDGEAGNLSPRVKAQTDRLYQRLVATPTDPFLMELRRNAAFVSGLLGREYPAKAARLPVLTEAVTAPTEPYIAVFAGASSRLKQWPEKNFAAVLMQLMDRYALGCLLLGGPEERKAADKLSALCGGKRMENRVGETSLAESVELVRLARLTLSNDSCGIHMAAAVGCPSVCAAGQWQYGRFLPYDVTDHSPGDRLPQTACCQKLGCARCGALKNCYRHPACALSVLAAGKARCIRALTPEDVLAAAVTALNASK